MSSLFACVQTSGVDNGVVIGRESEEVVEGAVEC